MMKTIFLFAVSIFLFVSCRGVNKENYANAAKEMCTCIEKQKMETALDTEFSKDVMHYAVCSFEVEKKYDIDIANNEFDRAISIYCPDFLALHKNVKTKYIRGYE